jgi:hypothetical protein
MRRARVNQVDILSDPKVLKLGARLFTTAEQELKLKILTHKHCDEEGVAVYKPDGSILFVLLRDVIDEKIWRPAYKLLRTVNGGLENRPGIIGENMRMPSRRKDGTLSYFNLTPKSITKQFPGKAGMLGYYKPKNPAPGVVACQPTGWTMKKPELYLGVRDFIDKVDEIYRTCRFLKNEYAAQRKYVDTIPSKVRIPNTAFTTLYVLKNAPTAVHTDDFDYKQSFGVMASLGDEWKGNALVWPEFRVGVDYRPGDLVLGDVHEWHTNLPLLSGERVSCVFFVRTDMHLCPP